jgi:hypothetical protein
MIAGETTTMNTTIAFACSSCGKVYEVDATRAGRRGRCKSCGQMMTVPAPEVDPFDTDEGSGEYVLEEVPQEEEATPEPSSFVRTSDDTDGRTTRTKKRKPRKNELLEQAKAEAEEVIKPYAGLFRGVLIAYAIIAVLTVIVAAALPNGTFIAGAGLLGIGLIVIAAGYAVGVYIAYTEDLLHAALFLTIPLYTGYYIVTNWDVMWRSFGLMVAGGILLSAGATVLEMVPKEEPTEFAPIQMEMLMPAVPDGPCFLANLVS